MNNVKTFQKYIFKIHSARLFESKWELTLTIQDALKNQEIIAIADSTLLRMIDELNQTTRSVREAETLRRQIKKLQQSNSASKKSRLKKLYEKFQSLQFQKDYVCVIMDKNAHYDRMAKSGFLLNGIKYVRLLATNGGVKQKTIVFVNESLAPALKERLSCGRDPAKPFVPAKYSAYEALACSSTAVVSDPEIIVVKDCLITFTEDILKLDDSKSDEPLLSLEKDYSIEKNASDGFGLILPSQSEKWAKELGLDYLPAGFCTRPYHFSKGMLVTFDFLAFAREIAGTYLIKDAWGRQRDIRKAQVILTTSMFKLWDAYPSYEAFLENCRRYHFTFGITKVCPKELESERTLNYQFLQSYRLSDAQIDALIAPAINEIKGILGADYARTLLFLRGMAVTEKTALPRENDYIKALQIEPEMLKDPYVRSNIHRLIKRKIEEAATGAIKVHGNYQIACGDPYALCQSMFELPVTGLLKKDEFYSAYWSKKHIKQVAAFRAPMTCHNNIRRMNITDGSEQNYWYRYLTTVLVFNCHDTAAEAMNGEDFDGDMNFTTDNPILMENHRILPTILCIQRKAEKKVITEKLLVKANKASFGDDIGKYTNGITSQFELLAQYEPDSPEYRELEYRIMCGQLFQQNAIDKAKGILCRPRPKHWFDPACPHPNGDLALTAYKKPYFMVYIYPALMKQYKKYIADADRKCLIRFGCRADALQNREHKSQEESDFLEYYEKYMPVGTHPCTVNCICQKIENAFDDKFFRSQNDADFDYRILKSDACEEDDRYRRIKKKIQTLHEQYCQQVKNYIQLSAKNSYSAEENIRTRHLMTEHFRQECYLICPDSDMLGNIVLDLCYTTNNSKQFAWDICGDIFIRNLLKRNNYTIRFPHKCDDGNIIYGGERFKLMEIQEENA